MSQLHIDKVFADNLGQAFGVCIYEQITSFFNQEIPRLLGAGLNPLPFFGTEKKLRYKLMWTACLQGMAEHAVLSTLPEYTADEKLLRRTASIMQQYVDQSLQAKLFSKLSNEGKSFYEKTRRDFLRNSLNKKKTTADFAQEMYELIHGKDAPLMNAKRHEKLMEQMGLAYGLFVRMIDVYKNNPSAYERDPNIKSKSVI